MIFLSYGWYEKKNIIIESFKDNSKTHLFSILTPVSKPSINWYFSMSGKQCQLAFVKKLLKYSKFPKQP